MGTIYLNIIIYAIIIINGHKITVCCAAGNSGNSRIFNGAPWILTVGACSIDRKLVATVSLKNGDFYHGESLSQPKGFPNEYFQLIEARNKDDFDGKIVFFDQGFTVKEVTEAFENGAAGVIMMLRQKNDTTPRHEFDFPTSTVSYTQGSSIKEYMHSTSSPEAKIFFCETIISDDIDIEVRPSSSRGPSNVFSSFIKPDIVAPGVGILGADYEDKDKFIMKSGTSMACATTSGTAALTSNKHPSWSAAAIKSAIMTTETHERPQK